MDDSISGIHIVRVVLPWPSFHLFQEINHLWFVWCGTCGKRTSNQRYLCYNATGWSFWEQRGGNPSEFKQLFFMCVSPAGTAGCAKCTKQISREIEASKNATNINKYTNTVSNWFMVELCTRLRITQGANWIAWNLNPKLWSCKTRKF